MKPKIRLFITVLNLILNLSMINPRSVLEAQSSSGNPNAGLTACSKLQEAEQ